MVEGCRRLHFLLGEARWLGCCISIKCCAFNVASARPESRTDYFMGIGFARNGIGGRTFGGAATGEARHAQVEASPEKMHWTIFADETRAKFLEDGVGQNQYLPQTVRVFGIVGRVLLIGLEPHRIGHFAGYPPNFT